MPLWPFCSILLHFGAPHVRPLHDSHWLLFPSKCPFNPEKDHISHSGQNQNTSAVSYNGDHVGAFWCILVHLMCDPMTPPWLLCPFNCPFIPEIDHISLRTNSKCIAQSWSSDHFGSFWSILVHPLGIPTTPYNGLVVLPTPSKCPLQSELYCISSFGQNGNIFILSW